LATLFAGCDVTGTTLNLLKFPIMNPKPTILHRRVQRLTEQKSLIEEEERLRRKQFWQTRSPKHATLMGTEHELSDACCLFHLLQMCELWQQKMLFLFLAQPDLSPIKSV